MRSHTAVLLALAAMSTASAQEPQEEALETFFANLAEAAEAGDRAAYTALFLPDATMFLPNRPPLLGRYQIGAWFDNFRQSVVLVLDSYQQEQAMVVGDIAMIRSRGIGYYEVTATNERLPFDQKYLDVLRYADGSWYLAFHVASSSQFEPGLWAQAWEENAVR